MKFWVIIAAIVMGCRKEETVHSPKDASKHKVEASQQKIKPALPGNNPARGLPEHSGSPHLSPEVGHSEETIVSDTHASGLSRKDDFREEVEACREAFGERQSCDLTGPLELEGKGSVALDVAPRGKDYVSIAHRVRVRVFGNNKITACKEQVVVRLLDGLEGFAAKAIDITEDSRRIAKRE